MQPLFPLNRQQFIGQLSANSAAIFFSASGAVRSRDTEYPFCQDKYFYYLTGFNEPDAALLLLSGDAQTPAKSVLFCREKDPLAEVWQGRRTGTAAAPQRLGLDQALPISQLTELLPELLNGCEKLYWAQGHQPGQDHHILTALSTLRAKTRFGQKPPSLIEDWRPLLDEMRLIKSDEELTLIRKAVDISINGHLRAICSCKPQMMEYQLQAEIEHQFKMEGASSPAYETIVGGGENGCILHYTENSQPLREQELVLIDAGAEYCGYAGDLTRTFPVSGYFTPAQKQLYELVLAAQTLAIDQLVPGSTVGDVQQQVAEKLTEGLLKLGILQGEYLALLKEEAYKPFYMHGIGHWLGLDVHDVGDYGGKAKDRPLQAGMVLTVEPGLYIASSANVPDCFKGIGIRIEDNILITDSGNEVLSQALPKAVADIELLMAKASSR